MLSCKPPPAPPPAPGRYTEGVIFLPAINWLIAGGMVAAVIFVVIIALLITPPTGLISKLQNKQKDND
jgi:hypothetical protein